MNPLAMEIAESPTAIPIMDRMSIKQKILK